MTNDNYVRSRLLYIHIDRMRNEKPDPKVIDRLRAELPGFLHVAKQAYEARCRDSYEILTEKVHGEVVDRLAERFFETYEVIFQKHWAIGLPHEFVEGAKVYDVIQKEGLRSTHDYKDFTDWLTQRKGVVKRKLSHDGGRIRYYGMRKRRPPTLDAAALPQEW